jgi:N-acetylmuramoyl-L-alanine amidase
MMKRKIFLLDSGHGGMIDGVYQTAPRKMFTFPNHEDEIAYEGVINRQMKHKLISLCKVEDVKYVDICPTELDLDLDVRVDWVNNICRQYGAGNCVLISLHSNAGGGTGFEIWTSRGFTRSDMHATVLGEILLKNFPDIKFRKDQTDGDLDKESDFYILINSKCPAILPECLFFDDWNDYQMLVDSNFQARYVASIMEYIRKVQFNEI